MTKDDIDRFRQHVSKSLNENLKKNSITVEFMFLILNPVLYMYELYGSYSMDAAIQDVIKIMRDLDYYEKDIISAKEKCKSILNNNEDIFTGKILRYFKLIEPDVIVSGDLELRHIQIVDDINVIFLDPKFSKILIDKRVKQFKTIMDELSEIDIHNLVKFFIGVKGQTTNRVLSGKDFENCVAKLSKLGIIQRTEKFKTVEDTYHSSILPRLERANFPKSEDTFTDLILKILQNNSAGVINEKKKSKASIKVDEIINNLSHYDYKEITFSQLKALTGWESEKELKQFLWNNNHNIKVWRIFDALKFPEEEKEYNKSVSVEKSWFFHYIYNRLINYGLIGYAFTITLSNLVVEPKIQDIMGFIFLMFLILIKLFRTR